MVPKNVGVCIVVENLPVPFDRRIWQEARALAEAGYRVSVICPKGRGFEQSRETRKGIEIYRHRLWEASGPSGYLLEYAWALVSEFWLALKAYRRTRFRILHAANPPDTVFLIALFFKFFGVRFIFDHHDLNPELYEAKFGKRDLFYRIVCLAEHLTFRTAAVSIATNQSYREVAICRGGMRPERVFTVRSCPDLRNIRPQPPRPELKQGKNFLVAYVGVMGPQDGLDLLLESIDFIVRSAKHDDVAFVLIGAGTELPLLKELAAQKGLDAHVAFTDRIPDAELAAYLSSADVCVAPDPKNPMNDKSTMNKILEYMAYGKPVVLYDLTEGRRSAEDAALYARPNDPEDFARQILALLDSENLRRTLGARGRKRIEESLNWDHEKRALLEAYDTALDDQRKQSARIP
ncbi:MAG TPA: glycosyltransferase family 4 protein [Terriglobia bacterium]|nr:glycosyltransferase family 4 protein [Terriglobia bacterium]